MAIVLERLNEDIFMVDDKESSCNGNVTSKCTNPLKWRW